MKKWVPVCTAMLFAIASQGICSIGKIAGLEGRVWIVRAGQTIPARLSMRVEQGDEIRTGENGKCKVLFNDDTLLKIGESSAVDLTKYVVKPAEDTRVSTLKLLFGRVRAVITRFFSSYNSRFFIQTPNAVTGVRGTDFFVGYENNRTEVYVFDGKVTVANLLGEAKREIVLTFDSATRIEGANPPVEPFTPSREEIMYMRIGGKVFQEGRLPLNRLRDAFIQLAKKASLNEAWKLVSSQAIEKSKPRRKGGKGITPGERFRRNGGFHETPFFENMETRPMPIPQEVDRVGVRVKVYHPVDAR